MEELERSLYTIRRKNAENHYFTPSSRVLDIMKPEPVFEALRSSGLERHLIKDVVKVIRDGAWNVFAILILLGKPQLILNFIHDDRLQRSSIDNRLPFDFKDLENLLQDSLIAQKFLDAQWQFTAPLFSGSVFTRSLPAEFVLPFLKEERLETGSFGDVYKVQLELSYQRFDREPYHEVVRKEFKRPNAGPEYALELRNLSILRCLKHPNIIELLGAYTYRKKYNLIFPYAERGSLKKLMDNQKPPEFQDDEKFIIALAGLCSAVSCVHNHVLDTSILFNIGCHHDLKPSNIFVDGDKFILADFGLSRFKDAEESSGTSYKNTRGYYVAPECEEIDRPADQIHANRTGRSSDIWSLGCIMMEVVVYMKDGAQGVKRFEEERKYSASRSIYYRFHHGPKNESPAVLQYLTRWEKSENKWEYFLGGLLREMLQLDPSSRPKVGEVATRMSFIAILKISQHIQYLFTKIWEGGKSLQAFIERERFTAWLESCEMLYDPSNPASSNQWLPKSHPYYQPTLDCLLVLQSTLEEISPNSEKPKGLIYRPLEDLNNSLLGALPDQLQNSARRRLEIQILGAEQQDLSAENLNHSRGHELGKIATLLTIKKMTSLVDNYPYTQRPELQISPQYLKVSKRIGNHYIGHLETEDGSGRVQILCESKKYGSHQLDERVREELHYRLESIAVLLKKATESEFRVLHCLGYFHDPSKLRCGLVYSLPTTPGPADSDVVTLHDIIVSKSLPALGERISLALNLATSVMEFHKVGWLQKEISSFNIAFVSPHGSSLLEGLSKPYFLGFSSSRPNLPSAFSEFSDTDAVEFLHPEYQRGGGGIRYRPDFDYYSLGLVLLEIGFWRPLKKIVKDTRGSPEVVHKKILEHDVPLLEKYIGVIYSNVVKACLSGVLKGSEGATKESEICLNQFSGLVVEPLAKCVV